MESGRPTALLGERNSPSPQTGESLVPQLLDSGVSADPYPLLSRIRAAGPVWTGDDVVVFSSFAHCEAVLNSPAAQEGPAGGCPVSGRADGPREPSSLLPPEQRGLRELVARAFTPDAADALAPFLRERVDDLLDSVASRGRLEVVTDLAYPLPLAVMCRVLGVPAGDETWLHRQAVLLSRALDPHTALTGAAAPGLVEHRRAEAELDAYFAELARSRAENPGDDLLSRLLAADAGAPDAAARIAALCRFLLTSGYETTVNLVSHGVLALLRAPHELDAVRRDPGYARQVVEEVLRTDPPFQLVHRYASADLDVCGVRVPAGTAMVLLLAAAHRDPALDPSPDVFAPGATAGRHLAFGAGPRHCVGAPVARLVARLLLVRFAQRVTGPRFATGRPSYRPNVALRGLRALWIDADTFAGRDVPWQPDGPAGSAAHTALPCERSS